jgi:hypothetical protein
VLSTAPITAPSFDEPAGICAIVAVVELIRVETCGRAKPLRGECSRAPASLATSCQSVVHIWEVDYFQKAWLDKISTKWKPRISRNCSQQENTYQMGQLRAVISASKSNSFQLACRESHTKQEYHTDTSIQICLQFSSKLNLYSLSWLTTLHVLAIKNAKECHLSMYSNPADATTPCALRCLQ